MLGRQLGGTSAVTCATARYRWSIGHRPIPSLNVGELCKIDARELSAP
jgi:hypothetical protein